jgi:hypothetical protein
MGLRLGVSHVQWGVKDPSLLCPLLSRQIKDLTQQVFNLIYHLRLGAHDAYSLSINMRRELLETLDSQRKFEEKYYKK